MSAATDPHSLPGISSDSVLFFGSFALKSGHTRKILMAFSIIIYVDPGSGLMCQ